MTPKRDLSMFDQANKEKIPWDDRVRLINKVFPSTTNLNWYKIFKEDPAIMGAIVNDIIKAAQASPSRPGKRASVDSKIANKELRTLAGDDYSLEDFATSLKILMGKTSIRKTATMVGTDRNTIDRLIRNKMVPTAAIMEDLAKAFGKDPSFFVEYREYWILEMLRRQLNKVPESSITFYRKMRGIGGQR